MKQRRSSIQGRGREIVGRGVDALFSDTSQVENSEIQVDPMLETENEYAIEETHTDTDQNRDEDGVVESNTTAAREHTFSNDQVTFNEKAPPTASSGVELSDEELLKAIDVPLGESDNMADIPSIDYPEDSSLLDPTDVAYKDPESVQYQPLDTGPIDNDGLDVTIRPEVPPSQFGTEEVEVLMQEVLSEPEPDSVRPQSPFIRPPQPPTADPTRITRTEEEEQRVLASIDVERITDLHNRIDRLYQQVPEHVSNRPEVTEQILGSLRQARTILFERPQDFVIAEFKIQQAFTLFNRVENSEKEAEKYGWRVFWFEVITFALLLFTFMVILAFEEQLSNWVADRLGITNPSNSIVTALGFWSTFVWGGIGGVVGAMYILWTHVSQRQDFERQHVMWYIGQPVMGLILGGVTFLVINAGLLSLQGGQVASQALRSEVQFFPALVAFIAGFRPQFIFGLLAKIINVISPSDDSE